MDRGFDFRRSQGKPRQTLICNTIRTARQQLTKEVANPGLIGTTEAVGFVGSIESSREVDIYRVFVGKDVKRSARTFAPTSGTRIDTCLRLYDPSGEVLKTVGQGGTGGTDTFSFTATTGAYLYLAVSSYGNRSYDPFREGSGPGGTTGYYQIAIVAEQAIPSGAEHGGRVAVGSPRPYVLSIPHHGRVCCRSGHPLVQRW